MKAWKHVFQEMTYVRILALGYLAVILLGAALLTLPIASANGKSIGYFQALFTATSATCVTGLVVLDTGTAIQRFWTDYNIANDTGWGTGIYVSWSFTGIMYA